MADRLGFSEAWVGEHMTLPWENIPSPELFIARASGETDQIAFGTGVTIVHLHEPIQLAHRIAMLDHLTKGRLIFGIGSGGTPSDNEMLGIVANSEGKRARMLESVDLILRLWKEGPFDFDGEYYSMRKPKDRSEMCVDFHVKPYQDPHPPIAIAGVAVKSRALQVAGERGWIPMTPYLVHYSQLKAHWENVETGAKRAGRSAPSKADWRMSLRIHVAKTTRQARKEVLNGALVRDFQHYWKPRFEASPIGLNFLKYDPSIRDEDVTPEYMMENYWIVGDPDYCIQRIEKLHKHSGGFGTLLLHDQDWGRDNRQFHSSMKLLATEVMPAVRDLKP